MKAVIVAGGKGTRLASCIGDIPKALAKIGDKTIIEHQLLLLRRYGIREVWLLLGYRGDQIQEWLKDGKKLGLKPHYFIEEKILGTAGALKQLEDVISEDFLVLFGDVMADFNIKRFIDWYSAKENRIAAVAVHPNDHPFDSNLVERSPKEEITALLRKPHEPGLIFHNLSIAGAYLFSPEIFRYIEKDKKLDIEKDVFPEILHTGGKIFAYNTPEYFKDMGTPERLEEVRKDWESGKVERLNLGNKRKAIFLDRDGVINDEIDQLSKAEDLKIYPFSAQALIKINTSDYLAVIITSQPMIAKGFITEKDLDLIHKKLETELGKEGAKIDAIYYCPHHPEKGFPGEVPELKIKCDCRKPAPGLFFSAGKDLNIDLSKSYMIGDQTMDILGGKNAGCKTVLVKTGYAGKDGKFTAEPDDVAENLLEAVNKILL